MISPKKLVKMASKWQKITAIASKRISSPRTSGDVAVDNCNTSSVACKGHFVIYTNDHRRFVMPLTYLNNNILRELFKMAEKEFGLSSDEPITLPCNAVFMEYVVSLIQQGIANDPQRALHNSADSNPCSFLSPFLQEDTSLQLLACAY